MKANFTQAEAEAIADSLHGEWKDLALLVLLTRRPARELVRLKLREAVPLVVALAESFNAFDITEGDAPLFPTLGRLPPRALVPLNALVGGSCESRQNPAAIKRKRGRRA